MNRVKIDSSNLHSLGRDESGMEVQFHAGGCARLKGVGATCNCAGGDVWHYPGAGGDVHELVMGSGSVGSAFHKFVKAAKNSKGELLYPGVKRG